MANFTSRGTVKPNYFNLHHGLDSSMSGMGLTGMEQITGADELLSMHVDGENMEDIDPVLLDSMIQDESTELCQLESQVSRLKLEEEERKKRNILSKLEKLHAVRERKSMLQKVISGEMAPSMVNPNQPISTPAMSNAANKPILQRATPKTPGIQASKPMQIPQATARQGTQQGEFNDLFNSLLHLQNGNLAPFAQLMTNRNLSQVNEEPGILHNSSMGEIEMQGNKTVRKNLKFENKPTVIPNNGAVSDCNTCNNCSNIDCDNSIVQPIVKECNNKAGVKAPDALKPSDLNKPTEEDSEDKKVKKRKSGILTKPDEVDILCTVRYPHELLDDQHVKPTDKVFSKLSFTNFVAGELELIRRVDISDKEKQARIDITETTISCYHQQSRERCF